MRQNFDSEQSGSTVGKFILLQYLFIFVNFYLFIFICFYLFLLSVECDLPGIGDQRKFGGFQDNRLQLNEG
jgi:hypothetical protein